MIDTFESRFLKARQEYIARHFMNLNEMQRQAVLTTEGPLLLLAGAGSGKTTVLIHRIANLLSYGSGSDSKEIPAYITEEDLDFLENLSVNPTPEETLRAEFLCAVNVPQPWNLIAITFTNKAANELKERLNRMLGEKADGIWSMTFHSACCRILRRNIDRLGYQPNFTIYDSADSERVLKGIIKEMGLDDKTLPARRVMKAISKYKNSMITPDECIEKARGANDLQRLFEAHVYLRYQIQLKESNAVDFDDIILLTVQLLQQHEDVRVYYQRKFRYVLVDEYQDTNHLQYLLTSILAGGYENICVVGDDDQSIYRFRGATIENILDFENHYRNARVIRLEQNYRSTQSILNAANQVISRNLRRKSKRLWTANSAGEPVRIYGASDESDEAMFVAKQILHMTMEKKQGQFRDYAILYRTNAQSNAFEKAFTDCKIPYRIIGGIRFYDRAEVKDMLAYLQVINNRDDNLRLLRIINNPTRGLGPKAVETAVRMATTEGKSVYSVISDPYSYGPLEKTAPKFLRFVQIIEDLASLLETGIALPEFYEEVIHRTGYVEMLMTKFDEESQERLENIQELKSSIATYSSAVEEPTLAGFLEQISLYTDIEDYKDGDNVVIMMTMHASKGLEFPYEYLVGVEDGLFPGMQAKADNYSMEEERRLCYVAITRAKLQLCISYAHKRMLYGKTSYGKPSCFVNELLSDGVAEEYSRYSHDSYCGQYHGASPTATEFSSKPSQRSVTTVPLDLKKGDMVHHTAFGNGLVISVLKMGGDALLEIAFDTIGTKKLMAKTASAHMKKLS